jgi:predicted Rossmann fold nucleotide-binding protein DprA/Smf involved in DNA uptake
MPRSDTLGGNLHLHHGDAIGYEGATVQELAEACDVDVEEMTFTLIRLGCEGKVETDTVLWRLTRPGA